VKIVRLVGLALLAFAASANAVDQRAENRAQAEATVIVELMRDDTGPIVVDLPPADITAIKTASPQLSQRLLTRHEFDRKYRGWKSAPKGTSDISISVVRIDSNSAVIVAGSPLIGVSGSRDRFVLKKQRGKWRIVHRDRNYEVA
jgi:hypothetical protein